MVSLHIYLVCWQWSPLSNLLILPMLLAQFTCIWPKHCPRLQCCWSAWLCTCWFSSNHQSIVGQCSRQIPWWYCSYWVVCWFIDQTGTIATMRNHCHNKHRLCNKGSQTSKASFPAHTALTKWCNVCLEMCVHPSETINGRTAMLGVVIGLIYEKVTGEMLLGHAKVFMISDWCWPLAPVAYLGWQKVTGEMLCLWGRAWVLAPLQMYMMHQWWLMSLYPQTTQLHVYPQKTQLHANILSCSSVTPVYSDAKDGGWFEWALHCEFKCVAVTCITGSKASMVVLLWAVYAIDMSIVCDWYGSAHSRDQRALM